MIAALAESNDISSTFESTSTILAVKFTATRTGGTAVKRFSITLTQQEPAPAVRKIIRILALLSFNPVPATTQVKDYSFDHRLSERLLIDTKQKIGGVTLWEDGLAAGEEVAVVAEVLFIPGDRR